jgi:hypothetical protein
MLPEVAPRQEAGRSYEKHEQLQEVMEGAALVAVAVLDTEDVNAFDNLATRLAGIAENDGFDVVATPGESLGVTADAVVTFIESVR